MPALEAAAIDAALSRFRGVISQVPPQVSAVHVDGQRAYQRVRRGETLSLAPRPVRIDRLELLGWDPARARLQLEVSCSAGTYIRSLARDLGALLGCGGALASLRRTAALGFSLEQAVPLEALEQLTPPALLEPLAALAHLPRQRLGPEQLAGWRCGRRLDAGSPGGSALSVGQAVVVVTADGNLAGMARATADGQLQPKLVLEAAG